MRYLLMVKKTAEELFPLPFFLSYHMEVVDSGHGLLACDSICPPAVEPDSIQPCLNPARQLTAVAIVDSVLVALRESFFSCDTVHIECCALAVENALKLGP